MEKKGYRNKAIKSRDIKAIIIAIISFLPGFLMGLIRPDIWIVAERKDEAKDNAYCFFKYVCNKECKRNIYYAIDDNCSDYEKVAKIGKTIKFGSFKHYVYTWAAQKYISSQYSNGMPSRVMFYLWLFGILKLSFCFLQHGVTQNASSYLRIPSKKVSFFACVAEREAEFVQQLGYSKNSVKITGFCRFDELKEKRGDDVFIMFTWRNYLTNLSSEEFKKTLYFRKLEELINCDLWEKYYPNSKVIFLLHPGMAKFMTAFNSSIDNVEIADNDKYTFAELINNSSLFITDFSSVAFDFAYLGKEICYLQFDTDEFRKKHLQQGYYNYIQDGFGPVFENVEDICLYLQRNRFEQEKIYKKRASDFFKYHDERNCERIFREVERIK